MEPARFAPSSRKANYDARIDFFRGLALIFIFINHIPDNTLSYFTTRSFALFDSAEVFMFLGGYSAVLAYSALIPQGLEALARKASRRALTILAYHIGLLVIILLSAYATPELLGLPSGYEIFVDKFASEPLRTLIATPLLAFQAPLLDILPMYVVVMLCAPFMIWLLARSPLALLAASGFVWLFAAQFFPHMPTVTYHFYWGFNPFCWQFMFAIGLVCSWYGRNGALPINTVEARTVFDLLSLAFVLFSVIVVLTSILSTSDLETARRLRQLYLGLNKQSLDAWRIIGLVTTTYLVVRMVPRQAPWLFGRAASWVRAAGSRSLPIFSLGVLLSFAGKLVTIACARSFLSYLFVTVLGIMILLSVAVLLREANAARRTRFIAQGAPGSRA
jgi:hypothetical protein